MKTHKKIDKQKIKNQIEKRRIYCLPLVEIIIIATRNILMRFLIGLLIRCAMVVDDTLESDIFVMLTTILDAIDIFTIIKIEKNMPFICSSLSYFSLCTGILCLCKQRTTIFNKISNLMAFCVAYLVSSLCVSVYCNINVGLFFNSFFPTNIYYTYFSCFFFVLPEVALNKNIIFFCCPIRRYYFSQYIFLFQSFFPFCFIYRNLFFMFC